jgi:hypothetical protein
MWGLRRETYAAVRVTLWCARDGSNKRKSGWVMAYLGSFTLTSCTSTMSVVGLAVVSSVIRAVVLRFVLWDTIRRVAADELYLFITGHGSVGDKGGFGGDVFEGDCLRSCFLPGFSYCVDFNGASGVVCGVLGVGVSHGCTVRTLVLRVDALAALHSGTFGALVVFVGVSGGADCAGGSVSYPTFKTYYKNGDSHQVMTQAIGQEPLLTTLHPRPAGSRIMGGQEKSQRHLGWGNPGQPTRLDCFQSMTAVTNAQPYPE